MKNAQTTFKPKFPAVTVNPELNRHQGQTLFPEKLAKAKEQLKNAKLPFDPNAAEPSSLSK